MLQVNDNLNPYDADMTSHQSSDESFIPSMLDSDGGELRDCRECDRPNNSERYMVQCQNCSRWYHFSCANVDTATVRSTSFVCKQCAPGGGLNASEPSPSSISSSSSTRRARVELELKRLDEERKLLEDLSRERIEKERALNERELQEKLERERQFIARRHELLTQNDGEESGSVRSMRSQRSAKRTEDWVRQTGAAENSGNVVEPMPTSTSVSTGNLGDSQVVHPSSTPLKHVAAVVSPTIGDNTWQHHYRK